MFEQEYRHICAERRYVCAQILRIQVKKCDNYLVSESQLQNTAAGNQNPSEPNLAIKLAF